MKKKLRVGLLIEDYHIPAWAFKMLEIINLSEHSEIILIVKKVKNEKIQKTLLIRLFNDRKKLLFIQ